MAPESEAREQFWETFINCAKSNPGALRYIVMVMESDLLRPLRRIQLWIEAVWRHGMPGS